MHACRCAAFAVGSGKTFSITCPSCDGNVRTRTTPRPHPHGPCGCAPARAAAGRLTCGGNVVCGQVPCIGKEVTDANGYCESRHKTACIGDAVVDDNGLSRLQTSPRPPSLAPSRRRVDGTAACCELWTECCGAGRRPCCLCELCGAAEASVHACHHAHGRWGFDAVWRAHAPPPSRMCVHLRVGVCGCKAPSCEGPQVTTDSKGNCIPKVRAHTLTHTWPCAAPWRAGWAQSLLHGSRRRATRGHVTGHAPHVARCVARSCAANKHALTSSRRVAASPKVDVFVQAYLDKVGGSLKTTVGNFVTEQGKVLEADKVRNPARSRLRLALPPPRLGPPPPSRRGAM